LSTRPFLSIVIPAHNEERRLPETLERVTAFLAAQPWSAEVLVVENGSSDRTAEVAGAFAVDHPDVRVLREALPGKGRAVRTGMLAARGSHRFMCDADLSMPIEEVVRFLPPALDGIDVAIGSREAPGAVRYDEPPYRHLGGRAINWMIRLLALPSLRDTQCGFKAFTARAAEDLFSRQTMTGWSFDVEVLFIARRRGYRIVEVPIPWYFNAESKLNPVRDALRMAQEILAIRRNGARGLYDAPPQADPARMREAG
jgi:glycosyltransferase involved in cell wall biosynthesis